MLEKWNISSANVCAHKCNEQWLCQSVSFDQTTGRCRLYWINSENVKFTKYVDYDNVTADEYFWDRWD